MKTLIFTPHPNLDKLDADFKERWAERLLTSKQYRGGWINPDDSSERCCLGEAICIESATGDVNKAIDLHVDAIKTMPETAKANRLSCATDQSGRLYSFSDLNDNYLTHPQINQLLRGETVTIEVKS